MLRKLFFSFSSPLRILVAIMVAAGFTAVVYETAVHRSPGPLTAVHSQDKPLGGYAAHSEFEQECGHCHAPIHCITEDRCQSCHIEIAEQRVEAVGLHGLLPGTSQCQSCHIEHQGREAQITVFAFDNVDHLSFANFSLANHQFNFDGSAMDCQSCHQLGDFGAAALDCINCHSDANELFTNNHISLYGQDCLSCHDGHDRLANFDHEQVFKLEGAHANTPCESCHVDQIYAGTPQQCANCHDRPDIHDISFGNDCMRCHNATAWIPAELRYHTFPLSHGSETQQECQICHLNSYTEYPCDICHEVGETRAKHNEPQNIESYENCLRCHPTGQVEEANETQVNNKGSIEVLMKLEP